MSLSNFKNCRRIIFENSRNPYEESKHNDKPARVSDTLLSVLTNYHEITKDFLVINKSSSTVHVGIRKFENWKKYTNGLDEDLLVINHLLRSVDEGTRVESVHIPSIIANMKTFIESYDTQLDTILRKGVGINHLHIAGAYPSPYLWVALMNNRIHPIDMFYEKNVPTEYKYNSKEELSVLRRNIDNSKRIRMALLKYISTIGDSNCPIQDYFKSLMGQINIEFMNNSNSHSQLNEEIASTRKCKIDYAEVLADYVDNDWSTVISRSLIGERLLLYKSLQLVSILSKNEREYLSNILWLYFQTKNKFLGITQQTMEREGLKSFEYSLCAVDWAYSQNNNYEFLFEIAEFLQESRNVVFVEMMISPQDSFQRYDYLLKGLTKMAEVMYKNLHQNLKVKYEKVGIGAIVHFKKAPVECILHPTSSHKTKQKIKDDFCKNIDRQFETMVEYIDSRGSETSCTCRIIGIDATGLENGCPPSLFSRVFNSVMVTNNNLRNTLHRTYHVGEEFNSIMTGLRNIYETVMTFDMKKHDRLGHCIALGIDPETWISINHDFRINIVEHLENLVFEWTLLNDTSDTIQRKKILDELVVMITRTCQNNVFYKTQIEEQLRKRKLEISKYLCESNIMVKPNLENYYFRLVSAQRKLINIINRRDLVIESNPTSNWIVGGLKSTIETPACRWLLSDLPLKFTINIDDPAVFANSSDNEYYLVLSSIINYCSTSDYNIDESVYFRLDQVRKLSIERSFIND